MTPDTAPSAILLIAHGSRRPQANDDLVHLANRLEATGDYPIAVASFLELAEPDIQAGGDLCVARGARQILLVPYFLSAGVHLTRDLTAACDELNKRHPGHSFHLGPPLGPHPLLDQLVLARAHETQREVQRTSTPRTLS